jgi:hypothetical protein
MDKGLENDKILNIIIFDYNLSYKILMGQIIKLSLSYFCLLYNPFINIGNKMRVLLKGD